GRSERSSREQSVRWILSLNGGRPAFPEEERTAAYISISCLRHSSIRATPIILVAPVTTIRFIFLFLTLPAFPDLLPGDSHILLHLLCRQERIHILQRSGHHPAVREFSG